MSSGLVLAVSVLVIWGVFHIPRRTRSALKLSDSLVLLGVLLGAVALATGLWVWLSQALPPTSHMRLTLVALSTVAVGVILHLCAMAWTGAARGREVESVGLGLGFAPNFWLKREKPEMRLSPWLVAGHVKFAPTLAPLDQVLLNLSGPAALLICAAVLSSGPSAFGDIVATCQGLVAMLLAGQFSPTADALAAFWSEAPLGRQVASVLAGLATINLLPLPPLNGGQVLVALSLWWRGQSQTSGPASRLYTYAVLITLALMIYCALGFAIAWFF
ncbi:MAG: M50 family metallopeptidase [Pseudomonadota bacterium]